MAARAEILGDTGESGPDHWEKPLGTADVHVAIAVLSSDEARLQAAAEKAREAHAELPGIELIWRQDCYQLADRADLVRVQGRHRPTRGRGKRPTSDEPARAATQGRRDHPRLPRRDGRAAADADPGGAGPQRHLRRVPQAAHQGGRLPAATCATGPRTGPRRTCSARRWSAAGRAAHPSRSRPTRDDPELGSDPRRNNDFGYGDDPRGFKCPVGAHARRANPRDAFDDEGSVDVRLHRMIRRGTSYGPMLPDGVTRGRRGRPRHHLRLRRRPPEAAVRVRQDPVAQRRHLHRRPARVRPARRTARRARAASPSRNDRSAAGSRTCRRSSSPAAASTASPRA